MLTLKSLSAPTPTHTAWQQQDPGPVDPTHHQSAVANFGLRCYILYPTSRLRDTASASASAWLPGPPLRHRLHHTSSAVAGLSPRYYLHLTVARHGIGIGFAIRLPAMATEGSIIPTAEDGSLPHWSVPQVDGERALGQVLVVPLQEPDARASFQRTGRSGSTSRRSCGRQVRKETVAMARIGSKSAENSACSQTILEFFSTTHVGRREGRTGRRPE